MLSVCWRGLWHGLLCGLLPAAVLAHCLSGCVALDMPLGQSLRMRLWLEVKWKVYEAPGTFGEGK